MITAFGSFSLFVLTLYVLLVTWLIVGWIRATKRRKVDAKPWQKISIIIPFRNEEHSIKNCLTSISNIEYPRDHFEVVLVNDHSTDKTTTLAKEFLKTANVGRVRLHSLEESKGKKAALNLGVQNASFQIIVTSDADCTYQKEWLQEISNQFDPEKHGLLVAPVKMKYNNLFQQMQALDFLSLIGVTFATHQHNLKILCNGANLVFDKSVFEKVGGYQGIDSVPTGDDILLMQKVEKQSEKEVGILLSKKSIVLTQSEKTLTGFLSQRIRWASKVRSHQRKESGLLGLLMFFTNLTIVIALGLVYWNNYFFQIAIFLFTVKCFIDFLFLFLVTSFFQDKRLLSVFIQTEMLNLVLVPYIAIISNFVNYTWKNRRY